MKVFPIDSMITRMGEDGLPVYDRPFASSDLRTVFNTFFTNGVFMTEKDSLRVTASNSMNVTVHKGICHINGAFGFENEERSLSITSANPELDRISTVVARLNLNVNARSCELFVKDGEPALKPKAPDLQRNSTVYEIGLADVFIPAGTGAISMQRVTDTRLNKERCGAVTPFVPIDTTGIYDQLQEQVTSNIELIQSAVDETTAGLLQGKIDIVAGGVSKLQGEVKGLSEVKVLWSDKNGLWMTETQSAKLSSKISEVTHGIVLHFQAYSDGSAKNYHHNYFYAPKSHILPTNGGGVSVFCTDSNGNKVATKYIYITDDVIKGYANNGALNYKSGSGILMQPRDYVMTEVLGV